MIISIKWKCHFDFHESVKVITCTWTINTSIINIKWSQNDLSCHESETLKIAKPNKRANLIIMTAWAWAWKSYHIIAMGLEERVAIATRKAIKSVY